VSELGSCSEEGKSHGLCDFHESSEEMRGGGARRQPLAPVGSSVGSMPVDGPTSSRMLRWYNIRFCSQRGLGKRWVMNIYLFTHNNLNYRLLDYNNK